MNKKIFLIPLISMVVLVVGCLVLVSALTYNPGDHVVGQATYTCGYDYVADSNYSDGVVNFMYSTWEIVSPSGEVVDSKPLGQVADGSIGGTMHFDFYANEVGTYEAHKAIFYVKQTYNEETNEWETTDSGQCVYNDVTDFAIVGYPTPSVDDVIAVINMLYEQWHDAL